MTIKPGTLCRRVVKIYSGRRILSSEIYMYVETEIYNKKNYTQPFYKHIFLGSEGKRFVCHGRISVDKWAPKNMIALGTEDARDVVSKGNRLC